MERPLPQEVRAEGCPCQPGSHSWGTEGWWVDGWMDGHLDYQEQGPAHRVRAPWRVSRWHGCLLHAALPSGAGGRVARQRSRLCPQTRMARGEAPACPAAGRQLPHLPCPHRGRSGPDAVRLLVLSASRGVCPVERSGRALAPLGSAGRCPG